MYPLLPNKMSMERDSNGCCIMCILVIAIISKGYGNVQFEIKRRKKRNLICVEDIAEDEVEII